LLREFETSSKQNSYLLGQLSADTTPRRSRRRLAGPDYYKKIDKAMIIEAAKKYLDTKRYVEVMLFPEKK
jgi:hypothetical protein